MPSHYEVSSLFCKGKSVSDMYCKLTVKYLSNIKYFLIISEYPQTQDVYIC